MRPLSIVLALVLAATLHAEQLPTGVEQITYRGWPECFRLSAANGIQVVIVPAVGGRVLHYGPIDANIIFNNPSADGKTLATHKQFWVGGYQIDIGPELRGMPPHQGLWMGPHAAKATGPCAVATASPVCPTTGLIIEKEFQLDPKSGALTVQQRLKNASDKEVSYCLWDRTLCEGGGFAFFPLNRNSKMKLGWSLRHEEAGKLRYDLDTPASPNVKVIDGVLVAEATARDVKYGKLGADSDAGWIAYARGQQLYIKTFPYYPDGSYTDGSNSVEFYWSDRVGEVEPLSPEVTLKPGASYEFKEVWHLVTLDAPATSFEAVRALVPRVEQTILEQGGIRNVPVK